jgi:Arc/MetJ-type ribon-helix-helix transcriptional regulator
LSIKRSGTAGERQCEAVSPVSGSVARTFQSAVERVRKASGKSRSAVVQAALRHWLECQAHAAFVREYEAGYRRTPEGHREIKAAEAAAVRLLATEDW